MRKLVLAAALAAAALTGCMDSGGGDGDGDGDLDPPPEANAAVVHRSDGRVLHASAYPGELPLLQQRYVGERGAGEPTIAVSRDGTAIYPSIEFDGPGGALARTVVMRSRDNGTTWDDASPCVVVEELPQPVGGVLCAGQHSPQSLDPYVYADPATGRLFNIDLYVGCAWLEWTDDGGDTWEFNPVACGVPVNDHQTLFSGPPTALPTVGYPQVLYYCNNQVIDSTCTHSLDGGYSWLAGEPVYRGLEVGTPEGSPTGLCGGLHGHGHASQATGTVYLPKGHCGQAWVAVSEDNGVTWDTVLVDASVGFDGHEAIVSTDAAGNAYYFFLDGAHLPRLSVSRDQGRTWSLPLNVTVPGVTAAKFPSIVAGDEGRIAFLYIGSTVPDGFDAEEEDEANATWNAYVGFSLDATSADPVFATVTANAAADPLKRGACDGRCQGMYDFMDIDVHPVTGQVWTALVDLCNDACALPTGTSDDPITSRGAVGVQVGGAFLRAAPTA